MKQDSGQEKALKWKVSRGRSRPCRVGMITEESAHDAAALEEKMPS